ILRTPIETRGEDLTTVAEFTVAKGDRIPFVLTWFASHLDPPKKVNAEHALRDTETFWATWTKQFKRENRWRDAVMRSLIVLKGLTYAPTDGLVAAPTTSLPERIGGDRNWDYRYCWLRDASLALRALFALGCEDEGTAFLNWILHATRLSWPELQILYDVYGETKLPEKELNHLAG